MRPAVFAMVLLLTTPVLFPGIPSQPVRMHVVDRDVFTHMEDPAADLIVQYHSPPTQEDLDYIHALHGEVMREFRFINALHVRMSGQDILTLTADPNVRWIEYNSRLHYLMDESTTTINASKVWQTWIRDSTGRIREPVDGTGITVVVVDSGIDAGHPDLDYGEKVIMNLKSDSDGTYTEAENTDTSSGHGTHCAGTIAGNGDASAGARRGVAPGAKLIGVSTGEAVMILNALGALEWVYEHSRPENNPYNIRVVSNSWGTSGEWDPNDAIVSAINRLTYDNNVVVVFAAGNAGGDGSESMTNPYSLTPAAISVAAIEHDGSGVASFSSRGDAGRNFTWPDIGAPGVKIWATEARKTLITAVYKKSSEDLLDAYYMAISGTSMATPHVAGLVALLWQAAPSMRVSDAHDDYSGDDPSYWNSTDTRIHEAELILKLTARYLMPSGDNGVPDNHSIGLNNQPYDFAQGYGLVMADRAVGLALTLEELRRTDPNATVWDALKVYANVSEVVNETRSVSTLQAGWFGDWSRLNTGSSPIFARTDHILVVPNGTKSVDVDLTYNPAKSDGWAIGEITVSIDFDGDGSPDWSGGNSYSNRGHKHWTVPVSSTGEWHFTVEGQAVRLPQPKRLRNLGNNEYPEVTIEYSIGVVLTFDNSTYVPLGDIHAKYSPLNFGEASNSSIQMTLERYYYNLSRAVLPEPEYTPPPEKPVVWWPWMLLALAALGAAYLLMRKKKKILPVTS